MSSYQLRIFKKEDIEKINNMVAVLPGPGYGGYVKEYEGKTVREVYAMYQEAGVHDIREQLKGMYNNRSKHFLSVAVSLENTLYSYSDYCTLLNNTKMHRSELIRRLSNTPMLPVCTQCGKQGLGPTSLYVLDDPHVLDLSTCRYFCSHACRDLFSLTGGMSCE